MRRTLQFFELEDFSVHELLFYLYEDCSTVFFEISCSFFFLMRVLSFFLCFLSEKFLIIEDFSC